MPVLRKALTILLLALSIGVAAAAAPEQPAAAGVSKGAAQGAMGLLERLGSLFMSFWGENGCEIDPLGFFGATTSKPEPDTVDADNGCHIDPLGGCTAGR